MFGSTVLEVGVGLVFVYWILSLICSIINEQVIVPLVKLRAKTLDEGIRNLLSDPNMLDDPQGDLVDKLYQTPLIRGLSRNAASDKPSKPSYIPGDTFALALMSLDAVKDYKANPNAEKSPIPSALKSLLEKVQNNPAVKSDPTKLFAAELVGVEKWYNDAMDRVTGWYKRRVQWIIFILGLVIVVALNVDTISIITRLSNDTVTRAAFVSAAQGSANTASNQNLATLQNSLEKIQLVGWSTLPQDFWSWILKIVGLLATVLAVSLGAPFWFDLLNKFMAFRSSGPVPQPRTGPSESTGAPQQLAVTVTGATSTTTQQVANPATGATPTVNTQP